MLFPTTAVVSLLYRTHDGGSSEFAVAGIALFMGGNATSSHAVVQSAGQGYRLRAQALCEPGTPTRYLYVLMTPLARSAACLSYHRIGPRLARWLLMSQDRAHSASFHVTHEFLAYMLGVRRVGIAEAAGALQSDGLIEYHRGDLTVLDRGGLEGAACGCYAADRQSNAELIH